MESGDIMRNFNRLILVSVAVLTLGACAWMSGEETAGTAIDDSTITAKVNTALMDDPTVKAGQVDVETSHGVVQLNGFVDSAAAKERATTVARGVSGVAEVHNN